MKLEDALRRYVTQLRANGRSPHTIGQAQRHIRLLLRWLEQERRSVELDAVDEDTGSPTFPRRRKSGAPT